MLRLYLPLKKITNGPLKMKTLKKTTRFGITALTLVATLATALLITSGCQSSSNELSLKELKVLEEKAELLEEQRREAEYNNASALITIDMGDGYELSANVGKEYISISKSDDQVYLDIISTRRSYAQITEAREKNNATYEMLDGPNGWQYYWDKNWDPNPETAPVANISRTFMKEEDNNVVRIDQYDYTGGKYDEEIDEIVSGIELWGEGWGNY